MRGPLFVLGALAIGSSLGVGCSTSSGGDLTPRPVTDPSSGPSEEFPGSAVPSGPPPDFGTSVSAETAPPPISGGTLRVLADGKIAVASDPDRDLVHLVDLSTRAVRSLVLNPFDEPGRIAEDGKGNVHVALRRGGGIIDVDVAAGTFVRREACAAPRGIAYDAAKDLLHVACVGGELVSLPASGGAPVRALKLDSDLRDVVVTATGLLVTRFRSAQVLSLDLDGNVLGRTRPFVTTSGHTPSVAWRAFAGQNDKGAQGMVVVHQDGQDDPVIVSKPGGYGSSGSGSSSCGGIVQSAVSFVGEDGATQWTQSVPQAVLPVDATVSGGNVFVVAAGNAHNAAFPQVLFAPLGAKADPCIPWSKLEPVGEIVAVDATGGDVVVQSRQPSTLQIYGSDHLRKSFITLSEIDRRDTGHAVFHANSGGGIACASCHPEGGDDGRAWQFEGIGRRRTQTFRGGLLGTEPFHWDGDQRDLSALVSTVFVKRMGGPELDFAQLDALAHWIDRVPTIPHAKPTDPSAVTRGDAIFHDADVGCSSCHTGSALTDNKTFDVGTGGSFQVPSLRGVAFRAPFLHSGCAQTLADRLLSPTCGGGDQHGKTSGLTAAQIGDLVAYLETL